MISGILSFFLRPKWTTTKATQNAAIDKTKVSLPFITADQTGPKHIEKELTRDVFESLCQELINRCKIPVEKALNDARLDKSEINEVVLVGGSTRIPAIQNLVESSTGK